MFAALVTALGQAWVDFDVYMPDCWATDLQRRKKAGIPEKLAFATKPELAIAQAKRLMAAGLRVTWAAARSGLVVIARSSGIPAARRRPGSLAHRSGIYTSKSAHACPDVVTYAANTVVTQFSTVPVHPACCGATHAVASPSLSWAVSSTAIPGPIRSPGSQGSQARARAGSSYRRSFQSQR